MPTGKSNWQRAQVIQKRLSGLEVGGIETLVRLYSEWWMREVSLYEVGACPGVGAEPYTGN